MGTAVRLFQHRALLMTLTVREVKARYRGSALGFVWSLANPLLLLAVYSLVFDVIFAARWERSEPYAVFLISGLFAWTWATAALLDGTASLTANASLIRKAVFPAEVLPAVVVVAHMVHFLLALPIVLGAVVIGRFLGYPIGGVGIVALPLVIALALVTLVGASLGLAALHVHFKDVRDLLQNLLTISFFLAPILYPLHGVEAIHPLLRSVVLCNPATPFIRGFQATVFEGVWPSAAVWGAMAAIALVSWWLGSWLFRRLSETLVEAV